MAYGEKEVTRQAAQPADLYKIFWGNRSVAGSAGSSPLVDDEGWITVAVDKINP